MIGALLLAAASPGTVLDAERAFAAAAKRGGQWTAFRAYAASEAVMLMPQPTNAQAWLKDRNDPAKSVDRWATAAWVSCDGTVAVDTGGYRAADGSIGYFTTVWKRQPDGGWKWIVDSEEKTTVLPAHALIAPRWDANCSRPQSSPPLLAFREGGIGNGVGRASDGTLVWQWHVGSNLVRSIAVFQWHGRGWAIVEPPDHIIAVP